MTEVSNLRCFWCNKWGDCVKNGIVFCWANQPFSICRDVLEKMDTLVDDYECPVCMETKKALEMPRCSHKVCLDCYKTIYFGVSEFEQPCIHDINLPDWTYERQFYEDGDEKENEKEIEHSKFLSEKMNYRYEEDDKMHNELIELRDFLMHDRPEWMNIQEIINYENELFRTCSEYRIKEDNYLANRTIGNQRCPLCRTI